MSECTISTMEMCKCCYAQKNKMLLNLIKFVSMLFIIEQQISFNCYICSNDVFHDGIFRYIYIESYYMLLLFISIIIIVNY